MLLLLLRWLIAAAVVVAAGLLLLLLRLGWREAYQRNCSKQFVPADHNVRQVEIIQQDLSNAHEDFAAFNATIITPYRHLFNQKYSCFTVFIQQPIIKIPPTTLFFSQIIQINLIVCQTRIIQLVRSIDPNLSE